jgi:hypothetical protein
MKIDEATGAVLWTNVYGGSNLDFASDVVLSNDKKVYYTAGFTLSNDRDVLNKNHGGDSNTADGWIFSTDLDGNLLHSECYGGSLHDYFMGIHPLPDGNLIIAGSTVSNDGQIPPSKHGSAGSSDVWFLKVDPNLNILDNKCFGGSKDDYAVSIRDDNSGNYYLLGSTASNNGDVSFNHGNDAGTLDVWLVKLTSAGGIIWERTYGGSADDVGYRFGKSEYSTSLTNGYIIGETSSVNGDVTNQHGLTDAWIVELQKLPIEGEWNQYMTF